MSNFNKLRDKAKAGSTANHPEVSGSWFNIRIMPDLATGEILNIGVGFVGQNGRLEMKILDHFDAFDCLYRNRLSVENLRMLVQTVRASMPERLPNGQLPVIFSSHVIFSPLKFISGNSVYTILEDLYRETVTLAHVVPAKEDADEKSCSLTTKAVRERVFEAIFQMDAMASHIVAEDADWFIPVAAEDGRPKKLDMPLRGIRRFGNVISAWYSRPSLELHMLRAEVELDMALRTYPEHSGGLFIMRPPIPCRGFRETHHQQIDDAIANLSWRMGVHHLRLEVESSEQRLAEHILEWAA